MVGTEQVDVNGAGLGDVIVVGVGDDDADGSFAAGEVSSVSDDANNRPAENLRDGLDAVDGGRLSPPLYSKR